MDHIAINETLRNAATKIDIPPSMYEKAVAHYNAVANYLDNQGLPVVITPYGSFLSGTPARPLTDDEDGYFDIDAEVVVEGASINSSDASSVRFEVESLLFESGRYSDRLTSDDTCMTLEYVVDGIAGGFRLDLSSCAAAPNCEQAQACATAPTYSHTAIAIAKRSNEWMPTNPVGLANWFLDLNERFAQKGRMARKAAIAASSTVYASVDSVPDQLDRSNLQCAVQIAKRSRDVFFHRAGRDDRPGSFVLLILFGLISEELPSNASIYDILCAFASNMEKADEEIAQGACGALGKLKGRELKNPVFDENVISNWTDSDIEAFFMWIKAFNRDLRNLSQGTAKTSASLEAIFGQKTGKEAATALGISAIAAPSLVKPNKPWRPA